jgi:hypothetical protein
MKVGHTGLEPGCVTGSNDKGLRQSLEGGAAKCAANRDQNRPSDPHLTLIIDAWPKLPEAVKAGIMAMVKASAGEGEDQR